MNKCYKTINFNINTITNFKPVFSSKNLFIKNINYKSRVFCKNLFIFVLLLKYKNKKIFTKNSIIVKKQKNSNYTFLRSPYRHKLARHQIKINRYNISFFLNLNIDNNVFIYSFNQIHFFLTFLKNFNIFFETNIIYMSNIKINFNFFFVNNFVLKKFINKNE